MAFPQNPSPTHELAWYEVIDASRLVSPALLVYPPRIEANIARMVATAGDAARLWPHVKTHKTAEIIAMQQAAGIQRFKCATVAEAELLGACGAAEVLLAMQPVGPNVQRFLALMDRYPETEFSSLVDSLEALAILTASAERAGVRVALWVDLNVGMDRTGVVPGPEAIQLYQMLVYAPSVLPKGLHAYDGHVHTSAVGERYASAKQVLTEVLSLKRALLDRDWPVPRVLIGGSPSFPVHAERPDVHLSPGTTVLWDAGYGEAFGDLAYLPAAVLVTRVVSKPAPGLLCTDLGHKAVASEMALPRVRFLGNHDFEQVSQSEEHLVLRTPDADRYRLGDLLYALPVHVCPTVAKYPVLQVIKEGRVTGVWEVAARDHVVV